MVKKEIAKDTGKDSVKSRAASTTKEQIEAEDDRLVNELINDVKLGKTETTASAALGIKDEKKSAPVNTEDQPIFGHQSAAPVLTAKDQTGSSPITKMFASLLMVIGVIGAIALAFRRFVLGKGISLTRNGRMIEVIANQTMGPKRSIAVVKVLDQYMVVGMSGDNMSLLSNLGTNVNLDKFSDDLSSGSGASFSSTFKKTLDKDSFNDSAPVNFEAPAKPSVRDAIKKRISGFKPL